MTQLPHVLQPALGRWLALIGLVLVSGGAGWSTPSQPSNFPTFNFSEEMIRAQLRVETG